jgi:eukaryotic-like serine/threonine-protein kinase
VGRLLADKWRIERLLGVGGMSAVYAARHRNGNRVAIKVLRPELAANEATRLRFLREGYIANRVGHEGATAVLDDGASDGLYFLVMELVEGESLEALCRRAGGKLPPEQVIGLSKQLLDVVAFAHQNNVIHRDIKPANVLVTRTGAIKLLDFGIATFRHEGDVSHTASDAVLGTPAYMSPEQARGRHREVDARTDIWGVGATMFRMLSGRLLHEGGTAQEVVIATATRPAPALSRVCPQAPPALAAAVDRALRLEPEQRFPNAESMRAALEMDEDAAAEPPLKNPRPQRGLVPRRVVTLALTTALAGAGALLAFRGVQRRMSTPTPVSIRTSVAATALVAGVGAVPPRATASIATNAPNAAESVAKASASGSVHLSSSPRPSLPPAGSSAALVSRPPVVGTASSARNPTPALPSLLAPPTPRPPADATSSRTPDLDRILHSRR